EGRAGSTGILFDRGRPRAMVSAYKTSVWPAPYGPSSAREFIPPLPALEEPLARSGAATGFHGLCGLDWIRPGAEPVPVFVELNGRPTPWSHLGCRRVTACIRAMLAGEPFARAVDGDAPDGTTVRLFPQDVQRAIES